MTTNSLSIGYLFQDASMFHETTGARTHILQIINGLHDADHRVKMLGLCGENLLCVDKSGEENYAKIKGATNTQAFRIVEGGIRRVQKKLHLPYLGLLYSYRFYEACRTHIYDYDVLHERHGLFSFGGTMASRCLHIPLLLEVNADPFKEREFRGRPLLGIQKIIVEWMHHISYKSSNLIFTVSEVVKRDLIQRWNVRPEKIVVLPNSVDVHKFDVSVNSSRVRSELGLRDESKIVVFIGSFNVWHDLDILVRAFAHVIKSVSDTKLLLIGDGVTRYQTEKLTNELGIRESVLFMGAIPHDSVPAILKACDIAVAPYPKLSEEFWGSPMKIFEYMAAGKAIVATRSGQIGEVIRDGFTGVLIEPGNEFELCQAIIELINNPALRIKIGRNAREEAIEHYSQAHYIRRLVEVYNQVISGFYPK